MTTPREAASALGMGFLSHDQRLRDETIGAFTTVDGFQFAHLDEGACKRAATAYVDALWAKDEIEDSASTVGELERADWTPVHEAFERRATITGTDPAYADAKTTAWRRHKTGGDYWTPMLRGHRHEIRAILDDEDYPHKDRGGTNGFGTLPALYLFGVEFHDCVDTHGGDIDPEALEMALTVLEAYFERIETLQP